MINLDKFNRTCNALGDLSTKIWVLNKTKSTNVEIFNMIS